MNILYLANIRLPTEKAHGVQIMKTCEALAAAGARVELCVTDRSTPITEDPFVYYQVKTRFSLVRLPVFDVVAWGRMGFLLESWSFIRRVRVCLRSRTPDVIFSRDELVLAWLRTDVPIVWETHTGSWNIAARKVAVRAHKIIAISQGLKDFYVERGVPAQKIAVVHDGVDLEQFTPTIPQEEARRVLGIAPKTPLVVYTGSQYARKGAATLRDAARLLPQAEVLIVSGKPHKDIPLYLRAADVLVLPNSAKDVVSALFTSPMKLFEYLASGVPLVASDIPSLREIIDERGARFFVADDARSLAAAITETLNDPQAPARAVHARELAARYSWTQRAQRLLDAI